MLNIASPHKTAVILGMLPAIILFLVFNFLPVLANFYYAFTDYDGFPGVKINFTGLENFIKAFTVDRKLVFNAIGNSFKYAVFITAIQNLIALIVALFLSLKIKGKIFFRSIYF